MNIEYYKTNKYGHTLFYVKDQRLSKIISNLTGKKTIDMVDMMMLTELGVNFIQVLE